MSASFGCDQLVLRDRLAHRLARLRVLERVVGRALGDAEGLRGDAGPGAVEDPHRELEALALLAEEVRGRDRAVVEDELAGRGARMPIFGSSRATANPGVSASTTKARDAGMARSGSVFAKTVYRLATPAFVMKRFDPSRTYSSPSRRAVVRIAALSEPEPDSVSAYAGNHSPRRKLRRNAAFCSSRPRELEPERAELLHREDERRRRADLRRTPRSRSAREACRCRARRTPPRREAEDVVLAEELDDVPGELVRAVDLRRARRDPLARELGGRDRAARAARRSGRPRPCRDSTMRAVLSR